MIPFGKIIDWLGQQLDRIKTISIALLVVLFIVAIVNNGCQKQNAFDLLEKVTGLNVQNDILKGQNTDLSIKKDSLHIVIAELQASLNDSKVEREGLQEELEGVKNDRDDLKDQIREIPTSELYKELDENIYPYSGEKVFPFNDPQIENIYYVSKDYELVKEENKILLSDNTECSKMLSLGDSIRVQTLKSIAMSESLEANQDDIILNFSDKDQLSQAEIKRLTRQLKLRTIGAGVIVVAVIILTL